jgi:hypothetical protein
VEKIFFKNMWISSINKDLMVTKLFFSLLLISSFHLQAQSNPLLVGMNSLDMKPALGIPLAGYGADERRLPEFIDWRLRYPECTLFRPSEGYHSAIRSKVMAIKQGQDHLILVSLDTIGLEHRLAKDVLKGLRSFNIKPHELVLTATHTHGGPGTLSKKVPLQMIAVDLYREKNYRYILNQVVSSIKTALKHMEPADVYKTKATINGVQRNKWRKVEKFDNTAGFIVARSRASGQWLGGVVNFSVHGGSMPVGLMLYSSDLNGAIEHELENHFALKNTFVGKDPVFLFLNGAEGDVGAVGGRSVEIIDTLSKKFMSDSSSAFLEENLTQVEPVIKSVKKKIYLGLPASPIKFCGEGWIARLPKWVRINLFPLLSTHSYISQAQIGDITLLTWPGEPSTQLGWDLQNMAKEHGVVDPWVVGLANDYASYFTNKEEFNEGAYDSCSSLYGPVGASRVIKGHQTILKSQSI